MSGSDAGSRAGDTGTDEATQGYRAATTSVAVVDRSDLRFWRFTGRDPARMLTGIVSGRMPALPAPLTDPAAVPGVASRNDDGVGIERGEVTRHTVLTPKGRMVAELRLGREVVSEDEPHILWALVPRAAEEGLQAYLTRYLPPRFAKVDVPDGVDVLGVIGPDADALVSRVVLGLAVEAATLQALGEGRTLTVRDGTVRDGTVRDGDEPLRLVRSEQLGVPSYEVVGAASEVAATRRALEASGATPATLDDWTTLRVEAGAPAYGADMDEGTIPTEAGLEEVAIDHTKGCYTGQEVIVRIRDRGHVNRKLLRVPLGDVDPPESGTELFVEGREKPAAEVRTAVRSPRFGETIGLAYVRREVWTGEGDPPEFVLRG